MRTTVRLDPHLLAQAKKVAAESGRTLTAVIEDALRAVVANRRQTRDRTGKVTLTVVGGRGPRPGVDLDDSAALADLMDAHRGSA